MKEQHQSPRITLKNLAFLGGLYCFYYRKKRLTLYKVPFEKEGKEGDRPSGDFAYKPFPLRFLLKLKAK